MYAIRAQSTSPLFYIIGDYNRYKTNPRIKIQLISRINSLQIAYEYAIEHCVFE